MEGVVKKWFPNRKYGFIRAGDGSADVFVFHKAIVGGDFLTIGEPVEYEFKITDKGREAVVVNRIWGEVNARQG